MPASVKVSMNTSNTRLHNSVGYCLIRNLQKIKGQIPSERSPKHNHLSVGPLATFSGNFIQINSQVFTLFCKQSDPKCRLSHNPATPPPPNFPITIPHLTLQVPKVAKGEVKCENHTTWRLGDKRFYVFVLLFFYFLLFLEVLPPTNTAKTHSIALLAILSLQVCLLQKMEAWTMAASAKWTRCS